MHSWPIEPDTSRFYANIVESAKEHDIAMEYIDMCSADNSLRYCLGDRQTVVCGSIGDIPQQGNKHHEKMRKLAAFSDLFIVYKEVQGFV